jgi:RNA polymerase sigma-70 factor (sigma-E family)
VLHGEHLSEFTGYAETVRARLRRQAFRLCGDWHEADDLSQDTLLAVCRRWPSLVRHDDLDGYTHTTMFRMFLSARRQPRWRCEVPHAVLPDLPLSQEDTTDLRLTLLEQVRRLPARQRTVVMLRFWKGFTINQTAEAMAVSPGTVASQAHKGLATLRNLLAGDIATAGPAVPRR